MMTERCGIDRKGRAKGPDRSILRAPSRREQTRALYDRLSGVYDLLSSRSERPAIRKALDMLAVEEGESVLEIGFGTGHGLVALARAVGGRGRVHGMDLSASMARKARGALKRAGLLDRVRVTQGDATRLPYASASMDAVFMSFTLELFDTPEIPRVLAGCHRVLKPGGRLAVAGLSREKGDGAIVKAFEWIHVHFPAIVDCRPIHVRHAVEGAGFLVKRTLLESIGMPVEIVLARRL